MPRQRSDRVINAHALADFLDSRGMTLKGLADESGVSLSYLSELASGTKPGTLAVAQKLADALGCHVFTITERSVEQAAS